MCCMLQNVRQQRSELPNVCWLWTKREYMKKRKETTIDGKVAWKACWQIRHEGRHLHASINATALAFSIGSHCTLCPLRYKSNNMFTAKEGSDGGLLVHSRHTARPVSNIEFWFGVQNLRSAEENKNVKFSIWQTETRIKARSVF